MPKREPKVHQVGHLQIANSYSAYREGHWPRIQWGVFAADGTLLILTRKFATARAWAKAHLEPPP